MNIKVNGKEKKVESTKISVKDILLQNGIQSIEMVTVQLNGSFLTKDQWDTTLVNENDQIDFIYFMGGGA